MLTTLAQLETLFTHGALAAAGAAAVSIPIAIHLLTRLRRRPQPWGAMRFLLEAYRKHRQRLQLEQWLLLLLRCAILIAIGLALAGPMLGGWAAGAGGPLDPTGRTVILVIDDALSSQATEEGSGARFDAIRKSAHAVIDGLGSGDRIAVFRAARPMQGVLAPPTLDRAAARSAIDSMHPRYSRSDLPGAITAVEGLLDQQHPPADRTFVILLSDLSRGTLAVDRPPPPQLASLAHRAKVLVQRPMPSLTNTQIVSITPRRRVVLAESGSSAGATTIPVELRLHRSDGESTGGLVGIELAALRDPTGQPIGAVKREVRWSAGQAEMVVNLDAPAGAPDGAPRDHGGETLSLRARIQPAGTDALAADNEAWATVEVRRRLSIAVIDDSAGSASGEAGDLSPGRWLGLALSPQTGGQIARSGAAGDQSGSIGLIGLAPATLDASALTTADAAMVLRPDLLTESGWSALRQFAQRGGLVWLFMPPTDTPAVWADALHERLGLDWRLGIETKKAEAAQGWSLAQSPAPEPLSLLAADWAALLQPVRVMRQHELTVHGGADTVWLRSTIGGDGALLASAPLGEGRVLLLATALDAGWTNLPAKPLFVPLLHETIRGVLGDAGRDEGTAVSGDQPMLGRRWEAAQQLTADKPGAQPVMLRRSDEGLSPVTPLDEPGVYIASPEPARRLAVNADPRGGDTRALEESQVAQWLSPATGWAWFDPANPIAALSTVAARVNIGWPLLWAVLALVVFETMLARWFSHARIEGEKTLSRRVIDALWGATS